MLRIPARHVHVFLRSSLSLQTSLGEFSLRVGGYGDSLHFLLPLNTLFLETFAFFLGVYTVFLLTCFAYGFFLGGWIN